ncbi:MAG: hydrolase 1, exosortase A system-associated [Acidobacteriales bacterium]|nr:hydrolase 1, exosortase A system-associated [Terriglobales bacterium]
MIVKETASEVIETAIDFQCGDSRLYGVLHQTSLQAETGLLMVHGRPSYRVGGHRVFVQLARTWAAGGYPTFRFDYRGTGDCEGTHSTLDETAKDIAAAMDAFFVAFPEMKRVVLWASCAGAADGILYASQDARVAGLALINPFSYDVKRRAQRRIRHYANLYYRRVTHRDWWTHALRGNLSVRGRLQASWQMVLEAAGLRTPLEPSRTEASSFVRGQTASARRGFLSYRQPNIIDRLYASLCKFRGPVMLVLSGGDSSAQTFTDLLKASAKWKALMTRAEVRRHDLPGADHSFRRSEWRDQVAQWTLSWLADIR